MTTPTVLVLLALGALAVAAGVWVYLRQRPAPEEPIYHFRCPDCGRRLRYRKAKEGREAKCPGCRSRITFPPVSEAIE